MTKEEVVIKSDVTKNYQKEKKFQGGIFSVGCYCDLNITLGFEIMTKPELEHNLFRLLMCRDLDMFKLTKCLLAETLHCGLSIQKPIT